jgi:hypothetical protein
VNGASAAHVTRDGHPVSVATVEASDRGIERVFIALNPEKIGAAG